MIRTTNSRGSTSRVSQLSESAYFLFPPRTAPDSGSKMDVAVLRGRIVATLDADADLRRRAELDLKAVRRCRFPIVVNAAD